MLLTHRFRVSFLMAMTLAIVLVWSLAGDARSTELTRSAELIMVEEENCPYCDRFNAEIAEAYPKTTEGKTAPLRRVDAHDPWPSDLADIKPENRTPTFILINDGKEVDRMYGYNGDEFFWFLLNEMLQKLETEIPKG